MPSDAEGDVGGAQRRNLKRKMVGYVANDGSTPRQAFAKVAAIDAPLAAADEAVDYDEFDLQVPCRRRVSNICLRIVRIQ